VITYIIDGYNVLHRFVPELLQAGELETARRALEARLESFLGSRASGVRIILVYDGDNIGRPSRSCKNGFEIVFSRPPLKADDLVLERCRELSGSGDVRVVTSDWKDIGVHARALRVRHVSSDDFLRTIDRPARDATTSEPGEKPKAQSQSEVDDWLRAFDFHPDED
jgi:predicted RNA-binding protein with PIN domain